jgi:hypothetical protein
MPSKPRRDRCAVVVKKNHCDGGNALQRHGGHNDRNLDRKIALGERPNYPEPSQLVTDDCIKPPEL